MMQQTLYEISRKSIAFTKSDEPLSTWKNSVLTLRTEKDLKLLKFNYNLQCLDKNIDCCITHIPCPKKSPASDLFPSNFVNSLGNFDFTQLLVNPGLWPHNSQIVEEMASIVAFEWSPPLMHNEGVVAILNNVGHLEVFESSVCSYKSAFDVSSIIKGHLPTNSLPECPESIEEVKSSVYAVETAALCWGVERNECVPFITAQKNGDIHFLQLQCCNKKNKMEYLTMQKGNCGEIVTMKVIPLTRDVFLLMCANDIGQLFVNKYEWDSDSIKLVKSSCLWTHKDKMIVKHIFYSVINGKIIVLCNKHRHLLVLMMDNDCNKLSEHVNNVNDYKITIISERNNEFYLGMVNCKVFKVTVSVSSDVLDVNITPVVFKENYMEKELFGLQMSKNNVFCALTVVDRKVMVRKMNITVDIIFLCEDVSHDKEITCLLNNPTKKLTDYWDCIEMIRYKTMKLKTLPTLDYNQLYIESSSDSYLLKVYYILLIFYNSLENILKNNSKGLLPETSIELVRDRILMLHAKSVMTKICKQQQNNDHIIDFEKESFVGARKFLNHYCQKYDVHRNDLLPKHVWNMIDIECEYTCQCCDELLNGFTCTNGHLNMFCALTLTPIEADDYLICKGCGILARIELQMVNPMCVFCDLPLNNYSLPS